ncbi:MAG: hypothetical protein AAGG66_10335, partial [Methanothrix soehngenii]
MIGIRLNHLDSSIQASPALRGPKLFRAFNRARRPLKKTAVKNISLNPAGFKKSTEVKRRRRTPLQADGASEAS